MAIRVDKSGCGYEGADRSRQGTSLVDHFHLHSLTRGIQQCPRHLHLNIAPIQLTIVALPCLIFSPASVSSSSPGDSHHKTVVRATVESQDATYVTLKHGSRNETDASGLLVFSLFSCIVIHLPCWLRC